MFEQVVQDDSKRFLKEAKDAMKPSYGSRKTRGSLHALGVPGGESAGRQELTFDEKALQLRKVSDAQRLKRRRVGAALLLEHRLTRCCAVDGRQC